MFNIDKIGELKGNLIEKIRADNPYLLEKYPLIDYVKYLNSRPRYSGYNYLDHKALSFCLSLKQEVSKHIFALYHKLLFLNLIENTVVELEIQKYPLQIVANFKTHFDKIISRIELESLQDEWFDFLQDKFCKDLCICNLWLVPVGPQLLIEKRIPVKFLFRGGSKQFCQEVKCLLFYTRGFAPVYGMHMNQLDPILMASFNSEGWKKMFLDISQLLDLKKEIKAVVGTSWFFDPEISRVSPEMSYFRELVLEMGGFVFKQNSSSEVIRNAIFMNQNRKKLYDRGEYYPINYIAIVPRKAIISWAQNQK